MNEGYTVEERYQSLLRRAEVYFREVKRKSERSCPPGLLAWLCDLEATRTREICEGWQVIEEFNRTGGAVDPEDVLDVELEA